MQRTDASVGKKLSLNFSQENSNKNRRHDIHNIVDNLITEIVLELKIHNSSRASTIVTKLLGITVFCRMTIIYPGTLDENALNLLTFHCKRR